MRKILFVCLGNICRSPLAEAIAHDKIKKLGLENLFQAYSCGTANYHIGDSPDPRTIRNAAKNGIVIDHVGRQLCEADLDDFDELFVMDKSNYDNVVRLKNARHNQHKIHMLRDFDPVKGTEVPDPYYGQEKNFQEVFDILDRSVSKALEFLQHQDARK